MSGATQVWDSVRIEVVSRDGEYLALIYEDDDGPPLEIWRGDRRFLAFEALAGHFDDWAHDLEKQDE